MTAAHFIGEPRHVGRLAIGVTARVERSIALLRGAIGTLEDEIAAAGVEAPKKSKAPEKAGDAAQLVVEVPKESKAPEKASEVLQVQPKRRGGIDLKAAWRRVGRWWAWRN
jgi:hypothetical protein